MSMSAATANSTVRQHEANRCDFSRRMLRLYRAAKLLTTGAVASGHGRYLIPPGDMLFLRAAVEHAAVAVHAERTPNE